MSEFLMLLLVGLVIGLVARLLMPGRDPIGLIATIALGIIGALIGGYLAGAIGWESQGYEIIAGVVVAVALLFIYRRFSAGRTYT